MCTTIKIFKSSSWFIKNVIANAAFKIKKNKKNLSSFENRPDNLLGTRWWGQPFLIAHLNISIITMSSIKRISSFDSVSFSLYSTPPTHTHSFFKALNVSHYLVLMSHFIKIGLDSLGPEVHLNCGQDRREEEAKSTRLLLWQQQTRKTITAKCPHVWTSITF